MSGLSYTDPPGDLSEQEALDAMTVEEKAEIAEVATKEFPHLSRSVVLEWLDDYGGLSGASETDDLLDLVDKLVMHLAREAHAGNHDALDSFCYGYVYEANIDHVLGIDPADLIERVRGGDGG